MNTRDLKLKIVFQDTGSPTPPTELNIQKLIDTQVFQLHPKHKTLILQEFDSMVKAIRRKLKEDLKKYG